MSIKRLAHHAFLVLLIVPCLWGQDDLEPVFVGKALGAGWDAESLSRMHRKISQIIIESGKFRLLRIEDLAKVHKDSASAISNEELTATMYEMTMAEDFVFLRPFFFDLDNKRGFILQLANPSDFSLCSQGITMDTANELPGDLLEVKVLEMIRSQAVPSNQFTKCMAVSTFEHDLSSDGYDALVPLLIMQGLLEKRIIRLIDDRLFTSEVLKKTRGDLPTNALWTRRFAPAMEVMGNLGIDYALLGRVEKKAGLLFIQVSCGKGYEIEPVFEMKLKVPATALGVASFEPLTVKIHERLSIDLNTKAK